MDLIKRTFLVFIYVTAGVTFSTAIFISIFDVMEFVSGIILWQIIAMSAVCACGTFLFYSKNELSKTQMRIRIICHYIYTIVVVFGGAFLWEWLLFELGVETMVMFILVTAVYALITISMFKKEEKTAEHINRRLRKLNHLEDNDDLI